MALSFSCSSGIPLQERLRLGSLIKTSGIPSKTCSPHESLHKGNWVKLICGASFEDVVDIRNLSLVYTLAGVDCIDCAAEPSVISAVNEGIETAREILPIRRPWVMISVNDHQDLHFRKAEFDPENCPSNCARPCEKVCPANAISLEKQNSTDELKGGVITERCYGCGRCFTICPYDRITEVTYVRDVKATAELLKRNDVDAVEIHTSGRKPHFFRQLWDNLEDSIRHLSLVAVSLPDIGDATISSMNEMYTIMEPHLSCFNLWQLDGRPMSGDIGRGATRESIAFAVHLASSRERPPGFLQLAGGTNAHTVDGLKNKGLFQTKTNSSTGKHQHSVICGIAYGGYARKIVGRVLRSLDGAGVAHIEHHSEHLLEAVKEALHLVGTVKSYDPFLIQL